MRCFLAPSWLLLHWFVELLGTNTKSKSEKDRGYYFVMSFFEDNGAATDVGVKILEFLPREEMDQAALVSHRFRAMRNHPGLDQTRTGTIRILKRTDGAAPLTLEGFINKIEGWNIIFQGNLSRLRIEGIHNIVRGDISEGRLRRFLDQGESQLTGVTWLDISVPEPLKVIDPVLKTVAGMVPNLEELTLNYVLTPRFRPLYHIDQNPIFREFAHGCRRMRSITWEHDGPLTGPSTCPLNLTATGQELMVAQNLCELYLKGSVLYCFYPDARRFFAGENQAGRAKNILSHCCRTLERVDLKGVTYLPRDCTERPCEIPQEGLIHFVRNSPNLTWFRSDLTIENVTMLQRERPDVTFVGAVPRHFYAISTSSASVTIRHIYPPGGM